MNLQNQFLLPKGMITDGFGFTYVSTQYPSQNYTFNIIFRNKTKRLPWLASSRYREYKCIVNLKLLVGRRKCSHSPTKAIWSPSKCYTRTVMRLHRISCGYTRTPIRLCRIPCCSTNPIRSPSESCTRIIRLCRSTSWCTNPPTHNQLMSIHNQLKKFAQKKKIIS